MSMLAALDIQGRVIKALFLREMKTRFGEKRLGFFWAFGEPIIHVLGFVAVWKIFGRMGPNGVDPMLFLVTGIVPFIMFSNIVNKVVKAVDSNKALLVFPQIKIVDFVFSRIIVEYVTYATVMVIFVFALRYIGFNFYVENLIGVITNFSLVALFAGGLGYILMVITSVVEAVETFQRFLIRIMYICSGVFFSIDRIPHYIGEYIIWNPLLHLMHMIRADFFPQIPMKPEYSNLNYVLILTALTWLLALVLTKRLIIFIMDTR